MPASDRNKKGLTMDERKSIPLVYPVGYSVRGWEVIGKCGRPLKADRRDVYHLQAPEGKVTANRYKIVWCARNKVDVRMVPREYSFRLSQNGALLVETLADRMSIVRKRLAQMVKVQREDYAFVERYAHCVLEMMDGKPDGKTELFSLLNAKRDEYVNYARHSCGGVSGKKAELYADRAIIKVYDTILSRTYAVPSPIASIKWHINKQIRDNRKERRLRDEQGNGG